jgi:hypothetical protein
VVLEPPGNTEQRIFVSSSTLQPFSARPEVVSQGPVHEKHDKVGDNLGSGLQGLMVALVSGAGNTKTMMTNPLQVEPITVLRSNSRKLYMIWSQA